LDLDEVGLRDDPLRRGGDRHGAGAEERVVELVARRERGGLGVDPFVDALALEGVGALVPLAGDVLEVEEARAVDELVEHPRRDEVKVAGLAVRVHHALTAEARSYPAWRSSSIRNVAYVWRSEASIRIPGQDVMIAFAPQVV